MVQYFDLVNNIEICVYFTLFHEINEEPRIMHLLVIDYWGFFDYNFFSFYQGETAFKKIINLGKLCQLRTT